MYVDVKTYLADDILTKVDKMSMAVSLEARVPLLDHKLIEFAARVPSSLKLRRGVSKYLLRQVLDRRVPRAILDGPKHGFTAPVAEWLRGSLKGLATELLLDGRLKDRGIFEPQRWHGSGTNTSRAGAITVIGCGRSSCSSCGSASSPTARGAPQRRRSSRSQGPVCMCGIAGIISASELPPEDRQRVVAMRDSIVHRGPDAEGLFVDGQAALGHRRLSIVDLGHRQTAARQRRRNGLD